MHRFLLLFGELFPAFFCALPIGMGVGGAGLYVLFLTTSASRSSRKKPSLFSRRGRLRRPVPPSPSVGKPTALSDVVPFRYIGRSPRRSPCFCPAERPFAHCFRPLFNPLGIERMDFCAP